MKNHYERAHRRSLFVNIWSFDIAWNHFSLGQDQTIDVAVFLNGCFFYVSQFYNEKEKSLKIVFEHFPAADGLFDYYVNVWLENGDFVSHNTIKCVERKGECSKSGFDVVAEISENGHDFCIKVSKEMLSRLVLNNNLNCSYSFFKRYI